MNRHLPNYLANYLAKGLALLVATASLPSAAQNAFPQPNVPAPMPAQRQAQAQPTQQTASPANLDALMALERKDFGVAPIDRLHTGPMHGPTPASIPGGQLITTKGLVALVQGRQAPFLLLDVLGSQEALPGAIPAVPASQPGSFEDDTQRGFGNFLAQATRGDKRMALVFYCQSTQCWMSYNAALRAIKLGYPNVLWYRGGVDAWKMAGLQLQRGSDGAPPDAQARPGGLR